MESVLMNLADSFAALNASQVAAACRAYLDARNKQIALKREKLIDADMRRRWFRPQSREQAEAQRKANIWDSYHLICIAGAYPAGRVENLLNLATAAGQGEVFVCAEDAGLIADFLLPEA